MYVGMFDVYLNILHAYLGICYVYLIIFYGPTLPGPSAGAPPGLSNYGGLHTWGDGIKLCDPDQGVDKID